MVSVDDESLTGGGPDLQQKIWDMAKKTVEEWTGQKLTPTSVYGIRSYKDGAILAPHVDRLPLISSMIINVDQDVDEDWPLEVYGHDGKAYNVTMKPGDMVLYESHSIIHGRPFPLKGRFYANIFVHFEPTKPKTVHQAAQTGDLDALKDASKEDISLLFAEDENLWQALHEAARSGHETIVKFLVHNGADINALTRGGDTPLDIAVSTHGFNHPIVQLFIDLGGAQSSKRDEEFEDSEL
jgi:prolyl 4-hydroxylase